MRQLGSRANQAALFIYRDDGPKEKIWKAVRDVYKTEKGLIRAELHNQKQPFLVALKKWNVKTEPTNSFLYINAHAGKLGMNCISGVPETRVSWHELAEALRCGVQYLWLMGCNTNECVKSWYPLCGPVRKRLLATSKKGVFGLPFVALFAREISQDPIAFDDEMPSILRQQEPNLAQFTRYFESKFRELD
jgi:hypothetical protein